ncbi:mitochondrial import inner membrane translocase subunit Tim21-like [Saccostrea echinata]|uniref:mitochondrial import inner membrane translocase subunit Tim21-like n=1 Tax=Saccostrea echinata TaxID=191078 RepID=UPI002A818A3A|nr:mitochondrial import inner membrane translocase subunit Tim21-like [Saccostrea echinata]
MHSLRILKTLTHCSVSKTVFISGRLLCVDILNCKRNILKCYSTQNKEKSSKENSEKSTGTELDVKRKSPYEGLSVGQKVVEAGKDLTYIGVILLGAGVIGYVFYNLYQELCGTDGATSVYNAAADICIKDDRVINAMGEPIKVFGMTDRRGRRKHVSHEEFMVNGVKHMRMNFYIQSPHKVGTVYAEIKQEPDKESEYVYLIVELKGFPSKTIVIVDKR